eukprot:13634132-Ditylum_brightwellii.AAC.1
MAMESLLFLMKRALEDRKEDNTTSYFDINQLEKEVARIHGMSFHNLKEVHQTLENDEELVIQFGDPTSRGA